MCEIGYYSLVTFREVFFVNVVHRKPEKCGVKSCECMILHCYSFSKVFW